MKFGLFLATFLLIWSVQPRLAWPRSSDSRSVSPSDAALSKTPTPPTSLASQIATSKNTQGINFFNTQPAPTQNSLSLKNSPKPTRNRRLVYEPRCTPAPDFDLQSSLKKIDFSVSKLLVCVSQLQGVPSSILAFKHYHQTCYAEYSVTYTVLEQIKTWDNMVIFRYIASKRNLKALSSVTAIQGDPEAGIPFNQFYRAIKSNYKSFDFKYYRSHYEAQAKAVSQFYEQNSISLQKIAATFKRVQGSEEFELAYDDLRNQVKTFESINQVIDSHTRPRVHVSFEGMKDESPAVDYEDEAPEEPDIDNDSDEELDSSYSSYPQGGNPEDSDIWSQQGAADGQWYPNEKQAQILNFDGVNYQVTSQDDGLNDEDNGDQDEFDADREDGNVLPIVPSHGARAHTPVHVRDPIRVIDHTDSDPADSEDDLDAEPVHDDDDVVVASHPVTVKADLTRAHANSQSLAYESKNGDLTHKITANADHFQYNHIGVEATRRPAVVNQPKEDIMGSGEHPDHDDLEDHLDGDESHPSAHSQPASSDSQNQAMNNLAATLQGLVGTLANLVQKTVARQETGQPGPLPVHSNHVPTQKTPDHDIPEEYYPGQRLRRGTVPEEEDDYPHLPDHQNPGLEDPDQFSPGQRLSGASPSEDELIKELLDDKLPGHPADGVHDPEFLTPGQRLRRPPTPEDDYPVSKAPGNQAPWQQALHNLVPSQPIHRPPIPEEDYPYSRLSNKPATGQPSPGQGHPEDLDYTPGQRLRRSPTPEDEDDPYHVLSGLQDPRHPTSGLRNPGQGHPEDLGYNPGQRLRRSPTPDEDDELFNNLPGHQDPRNPANRQGNPVHPLFGQPTPTPGQGHPEDLDYNPGQRLRRSPTPEDEDDPYNLLPGSQDSRHPISGQRNPGQKLPGQDFRGQPGSAHPQDIHGLPNNVPESHFRPPSQTNPDGNHIFGAMPDDNDDIDEDPSGLSERTEEPPTDQDTIPSINQGKAEYDTINTIVPVPNVSADSPRGQGRNDPNPHHPFDPVTNAPNRGSPLAPPNQGVESGLHGLKDDVNKLGFGNPEDLTELDEDDQMPGLQTLGSGSSYPGRNRIPDDSDNEVLDLPDGNGPLQHRFKDNRPHRNKLNVPTPHDMVNLNPPSHANNQPHTGQRLSSKADPEAKSFNARLHGSNPNNGHTLTTRHRLPTHPAFNDDEDGQQLSHRRPGAKTEEVDGDSPRNVFSKYIKKTLLPLDEPVSYPVNLSIEEYAKKKEKCRKDDQRLKRQIIHDELGEYPKELREEVIDSLINPEKEQERRAEPPNPVEINRRFDKLTHASTIDDRANPLHAYSHRLEEDERYDDVDLYLAREMLKNAKTEHPRKKVVYSPEDDLGAWNNAKKHHILLDANGKYAPRQKPICPCRKTVHGWEFAGQVEIDGTTPGVRIFHDTRTGPCKNCDAKMKADDDMEKNLQSILGRNRKLKTVPKVHPNEERRLSDLKAKFRNSLPI